MNAVGKIVKNSFGLFNVVQKGTGNILKANMGIIRATRELAKLARGK